jgi:transcriptional regulator with XRE-family HTH domain
MKFAEKLRQLRAAKGLSQKALAESSKLAQSSITDWETGKTVPAFNAVQSLCVALGVECTVFNGCEYDEVADKRGRGRPPKADAEPAPEVKAAKGKKPKRKGGAS